MLAYLSVKGHCQQIRFSIGLTRSAMRNGIIHIGNAKSISYLAVQINTVFNASPISIKVKKNVESIGIFLWLICLIRNAVTIVNTIMLIATAMIVNGNLIFLLQSQSQVSFRRSHLLVRMGVRSCCIFLGLISGSL